MQLKMRWTLPPNGCIKIKVDASKRYTIASTTIGLVRKDRRGDPVIKEGKADWGLLDFSG